MTLSERNAARAQLLADMAFELLMWNPSGDGKIFAERPITAPQRERVESLTLLSQAYTELVSADASVATVEITRNVTAVMATAQDAEMSTAQIGRGAWDPNMWSDQSPRATGQGRPKNSDEQEI